MDKTSHGNNGNAFPEFSVYKTRRQASVALAEKLALDLRAAIDRSNSASLVVSGGSSPIELFHSLRTHDLPWERLSVIPSDERVVAANHTDRNDAMIRRELLQDNAGSAQLLSLLKMQEGAATGIELTDELLPGHFDSVVLGMGNDGHTASLFPDSPEIADSLRSKSQLVRVSVPRLNMERVSLTPAALLASRSIDLLFFGQDKRDVYEAALTPGPAITYPIRVIIHQDQVPVRVFWAP